MAPGTKIGVDLNGKVVDQKTYQGMIGSLMYLTTSRPDIMFMTCLCARYQAKPKGSHLSDVKRIFRYLKGTTDLSEAEYVATVSCCSQVLWMRTQLRDYGFQFKKIPIYCDSKSTIAISANHVQHTKTKHIDVRYHFIKDHVEKGTTDYQLVDYFTKIVG
ncbi:hypothetical protein L6452_15503 [Arctium lappa]|uniref:Uncharacterized protein n=1 Tax=Arctium lappa TaxID=4217 RepID=A0ACB9CNY2_ARCLA|nr:hypothetical protein L6452_15503 [Arctium lappa]